MAFKIAELYSEIKAKEVGFSSTLRSMRGQLASFHAHLDRGAAITARWARRIGLLAAAGGAYSVKQAYDAQIAQARLAAVLRATGGAAGWTPPPSSRRRRSGSPARHPSTCPRAGSPSPPR